ncbi:MAG: hypothetical protein K9M54_11705 [Kiritimatiellales bacterium]|nr:hypothetical protein [Kiritimatiellales bacterium]MCF7864606.1 hypothetical protein [Kiritimatiellales bacterium]
MLKQDNEKIMGLLGIETHCVGVHELIDWQIIQYRQAVDAHRHDLSKVERRCVAWQEAEQDFSKGDCAAMGDKWRVEYCGLVCPARSKCLIALHFLHSKKTEPLYRAG